MKVSGNEVEWWDGEWWEYDDGTLVTPSPEPEPDQQGALALFDAGESASESESAGDCSEPPTPPLPPYTAKQKKVPQGGTSP